MRKSPTKNQKAQPPILLKATPLFGSGRASWTSSQTGVPTHDDTPVTWLLLPCLIFKVFPFRLVYSKSSDSEFMNAFLHCIPMVTR